MPKTIFVILSSLRTAVDFATHLPRYREILHVLSKYGLTTELRLAALQHLLKIDDAHMPQRKDEVMAEALPVRFRLALEELGPTFVKFGQILSSRRDFITDEFYEELCKLQDDVPPFPSDAARRIIHRELEQPLNRIFASIEDEPIAGASIAQVYEATSKDGTRVAIKVQRPDIRKIIDLDLEILTDMAKFIERHVAELSALNPVGIVHEFATTLRKELDFMREALNAERFRQQFEDDEDIYVPKVFRDLTTERVLTMEYISGIRIDNVALLQQNGIDPIALSERITRLIYRQIFEFGFFHADPHPGNFTVLPDGVVGLYDYGMMGTLTPEFRMSIAQMSSGLVEKNHRQVMRSILEMSDEGFPQDPVKMLSDVEAFSEEHLNQPLKDINLGSVLDRLLDMLRHNKLRMKPCFYLGIKALTQVEAIGRNLNPELNFVKLGKPYATEVIVGRYAPSRFIQLIQRLVTDSFDFLEEFPHDFRTLYQRIRRGEVSFPLQHKIDPEGFEPLRKTLDSIANRLTNAILAASVLICSAIMVLADLPPRVFGVPLIGLVGLTFGFYMCIRLVWSIWKHGGL